MSFWVLLQILVNLTLFAGVGVVWVRLSRPAKDDPRLSKGLQLLQSKISVLEDLSDRTETQVSQLTALMEGKVREIQEKIAAADRQVARIENSAQKSLEVASIFQDRIPHTEILERQNTIKYVTAARMAHQGRSIDEILKAVDLPRAEAEFIAKVNREKLQFAEEELPEWARAGQAAAPAAPAAATVNYSLPRQSFTAPAPIAPSAPVQSFMEIDLRSPEPAKPAAPAVAAPPAPAAVPATDRAQTTGGRTVEVRPVNFPRIVTR